MTTSKPGMRHKYQHTRKKKVYSRAVGSSKQDETKLPGIRFPGPRKLLLMITKVLILASSVILGALTVWLAYITWLDGHCSTEFANWAARKDFLDHCSQEENQEDDGCPQARKKGLPPPPSCLDHESVQPQTLDPILLKSTGQHSSTVLHPTTTIHPSSAITQAHSFPSTPNVVAGVSNVERSLSESFSEQATSLSGFITKTRTSTDLSIVSSASIADTSPYINITLLSVGSILTSDRIYVASDRSYSLVNTTLAVYRPQSLRTARRTSAGWQSLVEWQSLDESYWYMGYSRASTMEIPRINASGYNSDSIGCSTMQRTVRLSGPANFRPAAMDLLGVIISLSFRVAIFLVVWYIRPTTNHKAKRE